jgi:hypothetical protein
MRRRLKRRRREASYVQLSTEELFEQHELDCPHCGAKGAHARRKEE